MGWRKDRSRSSRRVKLRTPAGKTTHYKARNVSRSECPVEHIMLPGVPRLSVSKLRKIAKTRRRPQRPFGGVLSSRAMRTMLVMKAREVKQDA
ncbi:MAG TPA: 50S ribosomal protein L34e [Candidatus Nanoarchaeia archaeon]|nr:50S ribosomal protein L34e [Candidatus Nanoarchaeia archaeon]